MRLRCLQVIDTSLGVVLQGKSKDRVKPHAPLVHHPSVVYYSRRSSPAQSSYKWRNDDKAEGDIVLEVIMHVHVHQIKFEFGSRGQAVCLAAQSGL